MIQISKGDLIVEPLETLLQIVIRVGGRVLGDTHPEGALETWGIANWVWGVSVMDRIFLRILQSDRARYA